jgi:23S rRNA (cytosine1962-C5)-methyltransferase
MTNIIALSPTHWKDYELLDCGNFEKLERFGAFILRRPEPQAVWSPVYSQKEWETMTHAKFVQSGSHKGSWQTVKYFKDPWQIEYRHKSRKLIFKLSLTTFKHIGIFPEQAENWDYIMDTIDAMPGKAPNILNLFAYTGGASLAAKAARANVVHVDSIRQVVSWARDNMERSGLTDIRWTVEDAMKFVEREVKRGNKYQGVILDPPAYGIGSSGERWKLEDHLNSLLQKVALLLDHHRNFLVLNTYSMGFSSIILENLMRLNMDCGSQLETGELFLHAKSSVKLPLGVLARFRNW